MTWYLWRKLQINLLFFFGFGEAKPWEKTTIVGEAKLHELNHDSSSLLLRQRQDNNWKLAGH
ncbi:hypothetical protein SOVF_139140 [Spinacia oleracea]|nr:hypothetical protein SOVF_139140 [Spinacia oleracea]